MYLDEIEFGRLLRKYICFSKMRVGTKISRNVKGIFVPTLHAEQQICRTENFQLHGARIRQGRLFLSPLKLNPFQPLRQLTLAHWLPQFSLIFSYYYLVLFSLIFFCAAVRGFVFVSQQDGGGWWTNSCRTYSCCDLYSHDIQYITNLQIGHNNNRKQNFGPFMP